MKNVKEFLFPWHAINIFPLAAGISQNILRAKPTGKLDPLGIINEWGGGGWLGRDFGNPLWELPNIRRKYITEGFKGGGAPIAPRCVSLSCGEEKNSSLVLAKLCVNFLPGKTTPFRRIAGRETNGGKGGGVQTQYGEGTMLRTHHHINPKDTFTALSYRGV